MNKVQVLDCTLRDGGYCNQWRFGFEHTKKIVKRLAEANVDIIESGFLTDRIVYDRDSTRFLSISDLIPFLPEKKSGRLFVAMMNYGEYNPENLPYFDGTSIDGIRVAFHKKDLDAALGLCRKIKEKGYMVFVQAMVSLSYTDKEYLEMLERVNGIEPYAFYIVDSFGMMKRKSLMRLFYLTEHNLKEDIWIGFHSHNNMQLAYSNAQALLEQQTERNLIIDSSTYGMGRGAGNLNTELFLDYLNEHRGSSYEIRPLLLIIDEILNEFYVRNFWGYSLPNYLSAAHNIHPSYAGYFCDKNTLTIEAMDEIFAMMKPGKQAEFDKAYAETLYLQYMTMGNAHEAHMEEVKKRLKNRKVLLIAPGKSGITEKERVVSYAREKDVITVSVNFDYAYLNVDYIFTGNQRRFRELDEQVYPKCIITSNIPEQNVYLKTKYYDLLNHREQIRDNSGMMAIKFLIKCGVKEIVLAGFDGYSYDLQENYGWEDMAWMTRQAAIEGMNEGVGKLLEEFAGETAIRFLTPSKFRTHMDHVLELVEQEDEKQKGSMYLRKKESEMLKDKIYREEKLQESLHNCLEKIKSHKKTVVFGAGLGGEKTYAFIKMHGLENKVACFLDNNERKWETQFCETPVHKPDRILKEYKEELIIIACGEGDEIKEQLIPYGIPEENIIIPDIGVMSFEKNDYEFIWENMDELNLVYKILEDEKSRKVMRNILNYRISHDTELLEEIYDDCQEQYFAPELIEGKNIRSFLDCGSYIGDTLEAFLQIFEGGGVQQNMVYRSR